MLMQVHQQRLFFAYYKPRITINTLSEKAAPLVAPHNTRRDLRPSTTDTQMTFNYQSLCALARKNGRSHSFFLELLVLLVQAKRT